MQNIDMRVAVLAVASLLSACAKTPARPVASEPVPAVKEMLPIPQPGPVRQVQLELIRAGYLDGAADGIAGPRTREAISRFERANGLAVDGTPSWGLLRRLRTVTVRSNGDSPTATKPAAEGAGSSWVAPPPPIGPAPPPINAEPSAGSVALPAEAPSATTQ